LGAHGLDDIKFHPWFKDIDWGKLVEKKITPPFKPSVTNDYDTDNFDEDFTSEEAMNSVLPNANMHLIKKHEKEWEDFSYAPDTDMVKKEKD